MEEPLMKSAMVVAVLVLFAVPVFAVTYEWEDSQGTVNFTEDLGSVPKEYRKKVKIVGEEENAPTEVITSPVGATAVTDKKDKGPEQSAEGKKEAKKLYAGKPAEEWKKSFAEARWKVKNEEEQLNHYKERMKDTSKMSRGEYLSIQMNINDSESRLKTYNKNLESLTSEANSAGVPAGLR
jgi:hypothetical protein